MTRLIVVTTLFALSAERGSASVSRSTARVPLSELNLQVRSLPVETVPLPAPPPRVEANGETETYLNGRRVESRDVPTTASVARVVLAADGRTVVRIEFTTPR